MSIRDLNALEVGRTYEAQLGGDGVVLTPVVTRGRPRLLTADEIIAARALRRLGFILKDITEIINRTRRPLTEGTVSVQAVRTALGV